MSQVTSPFKFLDSYSREDADIFFGREQETEALYDALSGVKHLLVYGPSGAGKTSLIECGLRNQFSDADWFALTIRKGVNISGSVFSAINEALDEKISLHRKTGLPRDDSIDFGHAIESLFAERYQPIYLLFDQFEELLISGDQAEKEDFFTRLNRLIRYKVPCRVMLIMREEFIGHLSEFEPLCPSIFQHRFRLEKMRKDNVKEVIRKTLDAPKYAASFAVEDSEGLAGSILSKLPDEKREIELAHVQVFLSELWDRAHDGGKGPAALPMLRQSLIQKDDDLEGVLDSFLKKQLKEMEAVHGEKIPLEVLAAMISERHTKLQVSEEDLKKDLEDEGIALPKDLPLLLRDLESRRIIRTLKAGEKTQYEISHDVLALVVGQNLTKEMQLREEATGVYKVYEGKQGYLSLEDLDHIRPYQQYKALPGALARKVEESVAYNAAKDAEELENTRKRLRVVRSLLGLAIIAMVAAGYFGFSANRQKKEVQKANIEIEEKRREAQEALDNFLEADRQRKDTEVNALVTRADNFLNLNQKPLAVKALEEALEIDSTRQDIRSRLESLMSEE